MNKKQGILFVIALVFLSTGIALATSSNLSASSDIEIYAFDQNLAGYDSENGWVTLYNPSNESMNIGNWILDTPHCSTVNETIPERTILNPGAHDFTLVMLFITIIMLLFVIHQTNLLRKQIFGEVYPEARIKNLEFYLPERRKYKVAYFTRKQKEDKEVSFGEEIKILKGKEVELLVRFWLDAPQTLRIISFGFLDESEGKNYDRHPIVVKNTRAFLKKEVSPLPRYESIDWHDHYTIEYLNPRRITKGECMVISFIVKGDKEGKFPIAFHIHTDEAKEPYRGKLWVSVDGTRLYSSF